MFKNFSIKARLIFVVSFLSVLLALFGAVGLTSLQQTNAALKSLYEDRVIALGQLGEVATAVEMGRYAISTAIVGDSGEIDKSMDALEKTLQDGEKVWQQYLATYLTPEEKQLTEQFTAQKKKFIADGVKPAMEALHNRDFQGATDLYNGPLLQMSKQISATMAKLNALQQDVSKQLYNESQARYDTFLTMTIAAIVIGLSVALIMGIWLVRAISGPLNEAVRVARGVADGDLTQDIVVHSRDEAGQLMEALKTMNARLQQNRRRSARQHRHHLDRLQRNRHRQPRPVGTHRKPGRFAGRNRLGHGRTDFHRQTERRQRAPRPINLPRRRRRLRKRAATWSARWW
jgi:nitrogen fixation/metabolism regulation signal transduction histidine kinase